MLSTHNSALSTLLGGVAARGLLPRDVGWSDGISLCLFYSPSAFGRFFC